MIGDYKMRSNNPALAQGPIDYRLHHAHPHRQTRAAHSKLPVDPYTMRQTVVVYSQFVEMCAWAYRSTYSWRPEMDLYQSSMLAVFTAIPVLDTIAESPHECLLETLF
jgi:hypothetical protein